MTMFTRSILLPTLVACVIAAPFLLSNAKQPAGTTPQNSPIAQVAGNGAFGNPGAVLPNAQFSGPGSSNMFHQAGSQTSFQNAPIGDPAFYGNGNLSNLPVNPATTGSPASGTGWPQTGPQPNLSGLTPDFGASQTLIFPGDANGPDLSQPPMEFIPVMNFEEIFRFEISKNWIKSRWQRVSTSPGSDGLHGLRVALVTGTNSWDLHGSLTYFFDQNQQVQRITFRGWAGDASQLIKLLTEKFDFKTQPTQWAGFYRSKNWGRPVGGLLMKDPAVIYSQNPVQQVALILEINNPRGKFSLSEEFQSFIKGSQSAN
jgi:hypothetical protein